MEWTVLLHQEFLGIVPTTRVRTGLVRGRLILNPFIACGLAPEVGLRAQPQRRGMYRSRPATGSGHSWIKIEGLYTGDEVSASPLDLTPIRRLAHQKRKGPQTNPQTFDGRLFDSNYCASLLE